MIYKYKNQRIPDWDGLLVEVQLRTKLQHSWATAIETIQMFNKKQIKKRRSNIKTDWGEFFALVSSAFAYVEGMPMVERHLFLSPVRFWQK